MHTALLVPKGQYNPDLLHPVPYSYPIESWEQELPARTLTDVVDRNWAIDQWQLAGSVSVVGDCSSWKTALGGFVSGTPDPVTFTLTATFDETIETEPNIQPNFALENREELINWSKPNIIFSDPHPTIFPHARLADPPFTDVGGALMVLRVEVQLSISPYFISESGGPPYYPKVTASVSTNIQLANPLLALSGSGFLSTRPCGGFFPFNDATVDYIGGFLRVEDRTVSTITPWGTLALGSTILPETFVNLTAHTVTRFTPNPNP